MNRIQYQYHHHSLYTSMMSDYKVQMEGDSTNEFYVKFYGPKETNYEGRC